MTRSIKDWAQSYIDKGWSVVPLAAGTKAPDGPNWLDIDFTPDDFRKGDNIGIKHAGRVVITDCDCEETVRLADRFLPETHAIYGRKSKPRSKRLYLCPAIEKTIAFKDLEQGTTMLELRANHQDMAPPSRHPGGEVLAWELEGDSDRAEKESLIRAHRLLASAALIARYYPEPGARHDWMLAAAGTFKTFNLTQEETEAVIFAAATYVADTKTDDRKLEIKTTYSHTESMGTRKLAELAGHNLVPSLRKVWGEEASNKSATKQLNERHALLFQQSGDVIVLTEDVLKNGHTLLRFTRPRDMATLYPEPIQVGVTARGAGQFKPLGRAWLESSNRREYQGLMLAPNGNLEEGYYNLWRGWSVDEAPGDWSLFKEHITILCGDDEEKAKYVFAWMARAVQHPDEPGRTALTFQGGQGTGKSTFAKWFGSLFGQHFIHIDSEHRLVGQFNAHLHDAIIVFADEAVWAGGKGGVGALKRMITEDTLSIERKFVNSIQVKNMVHLIIASNEDWVVPAGMDDRRFAIFNVSSRHQKDKEFFDAVENQLIHGGYAGMLYDLRRWPDDILKMDIPDTEARQAQKELSLSPLWEWWYEHLIEGDLWRDDHKANNSEWFVDRDELLADYKAATSDARYTRHGTKVMLSRFLRKVMPGRYPRTKQYATTGRRDWIFPSLAVCREAYSKHHQGVKWDEDLEDGDAEPNDIPF